MSLLKVHKFWLVLFIGAAIGPLQGCGSMPAGAPKLVSGLQTVWQPEDKLKWESVKIPGKVATQ